MAVSRKAGVAAKQGAAQMSRNSSKAAGTVAAAAGTVAAAAGRSERNLIEHRIA